MESGKGWRALADFLRVEDGKEMNLDLEKMKIKEIQTEVDRHSRTLLKQEELNG